MCTVTVIRTRQTVRLACNRDELRSRHVALPPRIQQLGLRQAVLPIDPTSGGTWVAVNDAGLALALLNVNDKVKGAESRQAVWSRGMIIPSLVSAGTLTMALSQAAALDATRYQPFRLLLVDRKELAELRSDGRQVRLVGRVAITKPLLFTSSGLGDVLVEEPRRRLFARFFSRPDDPVARQDRFHRHRWPERPHLSVCMDRPDARTVSHTLVCLDHHEVTLTYRPEGPDQPAEAISVTMPLAAKGIP